MNKHTGSSYDAIARQYAAKVDSQPWNAFYERPGVISLLPDVANTSVLDAGCGSGWYSQYLLERGARVTAFDINGDFVELTRERSGNRARVFQSNLAEPLTFAENNEFDVAVCALVMHYLQDWEPALREIHRILKPSGVFVFSTHHPFNDWKLFEREDYFATELLEDEFQGIGKVNSARFTLI